MLIATIVVVVVAILIVSLVVLVATTVLLALVAVVAHTYVSGSGVTGGDATQQSVYWVACWLCNQPSASSTSLNRLNVTFLDKFFTDTCLFYLILLMIQAY